MLMIPPGRADTVTALTAPARAKSKATKCIMISVESCGTSRQTERAGSRDASYKRLDDLPSEKGRVYTCIYLRMRNAAGERAEGQLNSNDGHHRLERTAAILIYGIRGH